MHDVPEGHWSLGNAGYEVLPSAPQEAAGAPAGDGGQDAAPAKRKAAKRAPAKRAGKK